MELGISSSADDAFAALRDPRQQDRTELYDHFLRLGGPVPLRNGEMVVARHADAVAVLRNPAFGKLPPPPMPTRGLRVVMQMFLSLDPPAHTRLRKVVAHHFTAAEIARHRARIAGLATATLARRRGSLDVVQDFAYPFPFTFISELLGARQEDWDELSQWTRMLTHTLDEPLPMRVRDALPVLRSVARGGIRPIPMVRSVNGIVRYARDRLRDADAPVAETLRAAITAGEISRDEAAATWVLLFMAGHETSANLIANVIHALATHPDELSRVRADPDLVPAAVDETLRWDPPVPLNGRVAHTATEIAGTHVPKRTFVHVLVAAANRDGEVVDRPHDFRVERAAAVPHVSFGQGTHFCLGAHLARTEVEVGVATLLDAAGDLRIEGTPARRQTFAVSGFESLRVALPTA